MLEDFYCKKKIFLQSIFWRILLLPVSSFFRKINIGNKEKKVWLASVHPCLCRSDEEPSM